MVTFNDPAKEKLTEYLTYRKRASPHKKLTKVYTAWHTEGEEGLSEYGLNIMLKKVAKNAHL